MIFHELYTFLDIVDFPDGFISRNDFIYFREAKNALDRKMCIEDFRGHIYRVRC